MQDLDDPSCTKQDHELKLSSEEDVRRGNVHILLASPESLLGQHRQLISDLADKNMIGAIVIDEAHCVLKYGFPRKTKGGKTKKAFRPAYGRLLELRAIIGVVPTIALTATLTPVSQQTLVKQLNMSPCFTLILPPKKDNIKYIVHRLNNDLELHECFEWLKNKIAGEGEQIKKMLVFFHKVAKQSLVYEYLDDELGALGHKGGGPHSDKTHFFELYHMKTDDSIKDSILGNFSGNGHLRCVLASSSFSMGLDIPDVEAVIHFGPAMDLDDFLQETGRASRSEGSKAVSIVLLYPRCLNGSNISQEMKEMLKTKLCRRTAMLSHFMDTPTSIDPKHDCCDNCSVLCECGDCPTSPLEELGITNMNHVSSDEGESVDENDSTDDSDSDMEVYRRKPLLVLSDSE